MSTDTVQLPSLVPAPTQIQQSQTAQMVQPIPVAVTSQLDHTSLIITSSFQILTIIVTGVLGIILKKIAERAALAEEDRKHIKETLEITTKEVAQHRQEDSVKQEETLKVVNAVHTLVNHDMHVALQTSATLAKRISEMTKDPADVKVADDAQQKVADHDAGQARLDAEKLQAAKQQQQGTQPIPPTPQRREGDKPK